MRGPSTLLSGVPPFGNIGGIINLIPKRAGDAPLTRATIGYASDATIYKAIDVSRRFGDAKEWGIRFNGAFSNGATPIDNQNLHLGVAALALDYRGERLRASLDLGYQELDFTSPLRNRMVAAGIRIPRAPDLTLNQQQPWEYRDSANQHLATRVEYDLTPDLTLYGTYGVSNFRQEYFGGVLTIFNARGDYRDPVSYLPFHIVNQTAEAGLRGTVETGPVKHSFGLAAVGFWQDLAQPPAQNAGPTSCRTSTTRPTPRRARPSACRTRRRAPQAGSTAASPSPTRCRSSTTGCCSRSAAAGRASTSMPTTRPPATGPGRARAAPSRRVSASW